MLPTVYIETTIPSYLTAWPSRDAMRAWHQQITREWWERRRASFRLFTSPLALDEVAVVDATAARERLRVMQKLPLLEINEAVGTLTGHLLKAGGVPPKAATDAAHLAVATVHGMDYLLTWNCRHINNAEILRAVAAICTRQGYAPPMVCTPEELMG